MYSSQLKPRTNLNCGILIAAIILSHSTDNCSYEVFNSRDQIFSNCEPSAAVCYRKLLANELQSWSDTRETLLPTVLQLLRHCWNAWRHWWRGHVTLPHSCVIQVFIAVAWQQTRRGEATRHGTADLRSARRKHRFVYCCVIAGTCFEVTVLA
jgi:hypothetical protein